MRLPEHDPLCGTGDFAIMIKCGVWWQGGRDGGKDILGCASSDHYRIGES